jgi:hypothetical protein
MRSERAGPKNFIRAMTGGVVAVAAHVGANTLKGIPPGRV